MTSPPSKPFYAHLHYYRSLPITEEDMLRIRTDADRRMTLSNKHQSLKLKQEPSTSGDFTSIPVHPPSPAMYNGHGKHVEHRLNQVQLYLQKLGYVHFTP